MKYILELEPTTEGKEIFEILFQAVIMTDKEVSTDSEDDFIELLKKLKSVSVEDENAKIGVVKLRDLDEDGGTVELDRSEYKLLTVLVDRPIWRPISLEKRRTAREWLKTIKPTPETDKEKEQLERGKKKPVALVQDEAADA